MNQQLLLASGCRRRISSSWVIQYIPFYHSTVHMEQAAVVDRLTDAGVSKKVSIAGLAKLSRLRYS
jgi:hypothetical protein